MRHIFLIIIFSIFLVSAFVCINTGQNILAESMEEGSKTRVYEVFGMDCPGCHGGLEKLVEKNPAVQQAEANWEKKQLLVTVLSEAELNDEDIYDAIQRANFTVGKRLK